MPPEPMLCITCEAPITLENDSREHIFTNALGGRLKVNNFLCKPCNSGTGGTWDAALAEQMQPFCHLFGFVRERGEPAPLPIVTTADEKLTMLPEGGFALTNPTPTATHGRLICREPGHLLDLGNASR